MGVKKQELKGKVLCLEEHGRKGVVGQDESFVESEKEEGERRRKKSSTLVYIWLE